MNLIRPPEATMIPDKTDLQLQEIAALLTNGTVLYGHPGINGMSGAAIFLFHYARYSGQEYYTGLAKKMVDPLNMLTERVAAIGYGDGLAGFGSAMLYLSGKGLIAPYTAGQLSELDRYIYHNVHRNGIPLLNALTGKTGAGKYFIARLKEEPCLTSGSREFLLQVLSGIIDTLNPPYASYSEIIHAIDILAYACSVNREDPKAKDYLNYCLDKLETMRYEDRHFRNRFQVFDHLKFSLALVTASELSGDPVYAGAAREMLTEDPVYNAYLTGKENVFDNLSTDRLFLYALLAYRTNDEQLQREIGGPLAACSLLPDGVLQGPDTHYGLINGVAGPGMCLLAGKGVLNKDWLDLIPIVY